MQNFSQLFDNNNELIQFNIHISSKRCYYCKKNGHIKKQCYKYLNDNIKQLNDNIKQLNEKLKCSNDTIMILSLENTELLQRINNNNNEEIDKCSICLSEFDNDTIELNCGHKFHSNCYYNLIQRNINKCPVCRVDF